MNNENLTNSAYPEGEYEPSRDTSSKHGSPVRRTFRAMDEENEPDPPSPPPPGN